MNATLDTLVDRAARGVLLHSEGPALRAAVATLERRLADEHQTSALRAGIANDLRVQLRAAEDELARLRPLPAQLATVRAAVHIADAEDVTDWQCGYRSCSERALAALDGPADARHTPVTA